MIEISLRPIETASKAELSALQGEVFADYEPSSLLAEVLAAEASKRGAETSLEPPSTFGLAAFRGDVLVGWTQGYREGKSQFYMLNSGVVISERRKGVYSQLVRAALVHAETHGYSTVRSLHATNNNAVVIAKLRLGFQVSGFQYSEVYGPLVHLTFLVSEARRKLYRARASPIRPAQ